MPPRSFRHRAQILCRSVFISLALLFNCSFAAANGVFEFEQVADAARKLAAEPFKPPPPAPDFLKQISYDEYRDIRFDTAQSLWKDSGNFQVQFIHPGLFYTHSVTVNTIDSQGVRKVAFSPKQFTYGKNKFAEKIPPELGFAGFRIAYPLYKKKRIQSCHSLRRRQLFSRGGEEAGVRSFGARAGHRHRLADR